MNQPEEAGRPQGIASDAIPNVIDKHVGAIPGGRPGGGIVFAGGENVVLVRNTSHPPLTTIACVPSRRYASFHVRGSFSQESPASAER